MTIIDDNYAKSISKFSYLAGKNLIYNDKLYVNEFYLPLKYKFEKLTLPISSGKDANNNIFIMLKVIINNENRVIYIYQNDFCFKIVTNIFNNTYFLSNKLMDFLDLLVEKDSLLLSSSKYPKLNSKYNNKRIFMYSHQKYYAAITIQRAWIKYSGNPKYKYCTVYNINKSINETDLNKLSDEYKDIHYKYLFDRIMISLRNKFIKK